MKKLLSLSLMLNLGLVTVTPALNAAQSQQDAVAQSQANPAHVSGWQAAKKWWRSGRNMKALNPQEQRAFEDLKANFTAGTLIAAIVAIAGGGAAYFHRLPVLNAIMSGNKREVKRLIARGADVNAGMFTGLTPLIKAVLNDRTDIVKLLLKVDEIEVNATFSGYTALMWAAERGHKNMVQRLLNAGADRTIQTKRGNTAESIARASGHNTTANMIRNYGKDK